MKTKDDINTQCLKKGFAVFNAESYNSDGKYLPLGEIQRIDDAKEWKEEYGFCIPQLKSDADAVKIAKKMGFEFKDLDNQYIITKKPNQ